MVTNINNQCEQVVFGEVGWKLQFQSAYSNYALFHNNRLALAK